MDNKYNISDLLSFFAIAAALFAIGNMYFAETVFDFSRGISLESNKNLPLTASVTIFHCSFLYMLIYFRKEFNIRRIVVFFVIAYVLTTICVMLRSVFPDNIVMKSIFKSGSSIGKIFTMLYIVSTVFIVPYCFKKITRENILERTACLMYLITVCFALLYILLGNDAKAIILYKKNDEKIDIVEYKIQQNIIFYQDKKEKNFYIERMDCVDRIDIKFNKKIKTIFFGDI